MSKIRPSVKIVLDRERTLKFDLNAMAAYEEATGSSIWKLDMKNLGARELRALLWACLLHEDPALTKEAVGSMVTTDILAEISTALVKAFSEAVPEGEAGDPLPSRPTG